MIKVLDLDTGHVLETPFVDLRTEISAAGEGGLLGLAFDPDYAQNGFFYVDLINVNGDTEVRRYRVSDDPNIADAESGTPILTIDQPDGRTNHKAGWIGFRDVRRRPLHRHGRWWWRGEPGWQRPERQLAAGKDASH